VRRSRAVVQIEAAWLRFKNGPGGELLRGCPALRPRYLNTISLPQLPAEVLLPGAFPWNLLAHQEAAAHGAPIGDRLSRKGTTVANTVAVWAASCEAKTSYAVDPVLAETLAGTPWPSRSPGPPRARTKAGGDGGVGLSCRGDQSEGADHAWRCTMGLFQWLANAWPPEIEVRDFSAYEAESLAWEATVTGSKRGFLLGVPAGALVIGLILGGVWMTGLYNPFVPAPVSRPGQEDSPALQAVRQEVDTLRGENQSLKKLVMAVQAAAHGPPCQPQAVRRTQPRRHPVAPPRAPAKPATTKATAQRKASGTRPAAQVPPPVPSACRKAGDCQSPSPPRVGPTADEIPKPPSADRGSGR
jgi:hypothetical protein